ncbi:MAG: hypothetical protein Q9205_005676 [Flavoplaca limonia]
MDVLLSVCPDKNTKFLLEAISNGAHVQDQHMSNDPSSSKTSIPLNPFSTNNKNNAEVRPRLSSNALYMSEDPRLLDQYHDTPVVINNDVKQQLLNSGMDHRLATYYASIFARDPLVIWSKDAEPDSPEEDSTALFEAFQGTNYPCVRFKSPPSRHSDTGWRVDSGPWKSK